MAPSAVQWPLFAFLVATHALHVERAAQGGLPFYRGNGVTFHAVCACAHVCHIALAIFVFLGNWDSFLCPLVVLNSPEKQTLPLVLAGLRNLYWTRYEIWAAGSILTVAPVMLIYSFASKYFIQGIAMTGLKA